jgi:hypothetical protein
MSFRSLLNHTVRVYREPVPAADSRDAYGSVPLVPLPIGAAPASHNARPAQNWRGTQIDLGPGEQQAALNMWLLLPDVDARERDVLSVIEGPNVGLNLRILSVEKASDSTRVHHLEVNVEVWEGELP